MLPRPVHVPAVVESRPVRCGVPVRTGTAVLMGALLRIGPTPVLAAAAVPYVLTEVTATRTRLPRSDAARV